MSKIKANVPLAYRSGAAAERMRSMNLCFIFTGFVLYNYFDFTEEQLQEFMSKIAMFFQQREEKRHHSGRSYSVGREAQLYGEGEIVKEADI